MNKTILQDRQNISTQAYAVELIGICKDYGTREEPVRVLKDVSVAFNTGEFTAIMGPSGAGKTTLMQCAAGLDSVSSGTVILGDTTLTRASRRVLDKVRRHKTGFIFQSYNLLPMLTISENVLLPLRLRGERVSAADAEAALASVALAKMGKRLPSQLSGGQQQRASIARCLLSRPDVIFADEPTGALDQAAGKQVLGLMRQAVDRDGRTLVMVTHDPRVAAYADRVLFIVDGIVHSELHKPSAEQISAELSRWED